MILHVIRNLDTILRTEGLNFRNMELPPLPPFNPLLSTPIYRPIYW